MIVATTIVCVCLCVCVCVCVCVHIMRGCVCVCVCVNSVPFSSNIVKNVVMKLAIGISILVVLSTLAFCVYCSALSRNLRFLAIPRKPTIL